MRPAETRPEQNRTNTAMRKTPLIALSLVALAACAPEIPDSAAEANAGTLPAAPAVSAAPLDGGGGEAAAIAAETTAVLGVGGTGAAAPAAAPQTALQPVPQAAPAPATGAPLSALAPGAAVDAGAVDAADGTVPATLSDEQNFTAVSERETIASDAARIEENRSQYVVIEPTQLPPRPDGSGPSIVAFALATNNVPGQALYKRMGIAAQARFDSSCAKYGGDDMAQQAFLDAGGPKVDRYGMDPDGDGFACYWDPRPFRAARTPAVQAEVPPETDAAGN